MEDFADELRKAGLDAIIVDENTDIEAEIAKRQEVDGCTLTITLPSGIVITSTNFVATYDVGDRITSCLNTNGTGWEVTCMAAALARALSTLLDTATGRTDSQQ